MNLLRCVFIFLIPSLVYSQGESQYVDSLKRVLEQTDNDTIRLDVNRKLGFYFQDAGADIGLLYHQDQLELAQRLNLKLYEADAYQQIGYCYFYLGNLPDSYEAYMKGMKIAEDPTSAENAWGYENFSYSRSPEDARQSIIGMIHFEISSLYDQLGNKEEVYTHLKEAMDIGKKLNNQKILTLATRDLGVYFKKNNQPDSAYTYYFKTLGYYEGSPYQRVQGVTHQLLSEYHSEKLNYDSAMYYMRRAIYLASRDRELVNLSLDELSLGNLFMEANQLDSAREYTIRAMKTATSVNHYGGVAEAKVQLGRIQKMEGNLSGAYQNLEEGKGILDSLNNQHIQRLVQFQSLDFDDKILLQELEKEKISTQAKIRTYVLVTGITVFLLIALLLLRNNRIRTKANRILRDQKRNVEDTLVKLKSTQAQLVQSEKMASLGELTAGIAHEIQNPLNFVNNFSEVSQELIDEMAEEIAKGDLEEVKELSSDIKGNLEKIAHHGKRADAIVKGMLAHSRSGKGEKSLTDINALAEEYLKLAYHGLRAKDKSFNAEFKTEFDPELPKINVVPQDIGRVLLNLVNNSFQAVSERSKKEGPGYNPTVTIKTQLTTQDQILITIKDNGPGIPDDIKAKIFQPFFTTKPTGKGTGLGLSLSYDIIKAHGGEITCKSREGKGLSAGKAGTEFIIKLPK